MLCVFAGACIMFVFACDCEFMIVFTFVFVVFLSVFLIGAFLCLFLRVVVSA